MYRPAVKQAPPGKNERTTSEYKVKFQINAPGGTTILRGRVRELGVARVVEMSNGANEGPISDVRETRF